MDVMLFAQILTLLVVMLYVTTYVYVSSIGGVYTLVNYSSELTNFDLSAVSDFEDSFMLLSDSVLFLEQDGVFLFDYYVGVFFINK